MGELMDTQSIVFYLLVGLIVLVIVFAFNESLLASGLLQNVSRNLTRPLSISLLNGDDAKGMELHIDPTKLGRPEDTGRGYSYKITVTPKLVLTSHDPGSIDVISIMGFKGQSVRARIKKGGESDKFTIQPDKAEDFTLTASIETDIQPITTHENVFNGALGETMPILVKSGASSVLVTASTGYSYPIFNPEDTVLPTCRAKFNLRGSCRSTSSDYMRKCTDEEPNACRQSIDFCNGTVTISVRDIRCGDGIVDVEELEYAGGEEWAPGEEVVLSFWKDNVPRDCTRQTTDYKILKGLCSQYFLGAYTLNAGILPAA